MHKILHFRLQTVPSSRKTLPQRWQNISTMFWGICWQANRQIWNFRYLLFCGGKYLATKPRECHLVISSGKLRLIHSSKPGIEWVQALNGILRLGYVVIATKPLHLLQMCPISHNCGAPPLFPKSHPGPCGSVGMRRGTESHRRPWPIYILPRLRVTVMWNVIR